MSAAPKVLISSQSEPTVHQDSPLKNSENRIQVHTAQSGELGRLDLQLNHRGPPNHQSEPEIGRPILCAAKHRLVFAA